MRAICQLAYNSRLKWYFYLAKLIEGGLNGLIPQDGKFLGED
jgi:hypothetical protein